MAKPLLAHNADILRADFRLFQHELPFPRSRKSREQRFREKVAKPTAPDACWPWLGSVSQETAYGQFYDTSPESGRKTMRKAHRVAWELHNEQALTAGQRVLHARGCMKTCCNPQHLRLGTAAENTADAKAEGRLKGSKLDDGKVLKIVALRNKFGLESWVLADHFGVSCQTINSILKGKSWGKVTKIVDVPRQTGRPPKLRLVENDPPIGLPQFLTRNSSAGVDKFEAVA